ncbi:MAG: hypothetical protein ACYTAS_19445 [Planctomycetota bacterium]|jgi:hypothetical protein
MNELLVRIETLCLEVNPPVLVGVGAGMAVVGLFLWLGGTRYSTVVIGLLGAAVGALAGLAVSTQFSIHPLLGIAVGAVILGLISILLRNLLIIVLATIIFALAAAGGYVSVVLDSQPADETVSSDPQAVGTEQPLLFQSFSHTDPNTNQAYLYEIAGPEADFEGKSKAMLSDTWAALGPHKWFVLGAVLVGGVGGFLLIWFIKQVVVPLCYSIVGTASVLLGAQLLLLGVGLRVASGLPAQRWIVPATAGSMTLIGWVWQLLAARKPPAKAPRRSDQEASDD